MARAQGWALGLAAAVALGASGQEAQREAGLLFHAAFDGSAVATYASGAAGPLTATQVQFVPGLAGQAVKVPRGGVLTYATQANLNRDRGTVMFWLQRPVLSASALAELRATWRAQYLFGGKTKNGGMANLRLGFADFLVAELAGRKLSSSLYGSWPAGTWHQVAVTWDKDSEACLYLDGQYLPSGNETLGGLRYPCPFEPEKVEEMSVGCLGDSGQSEVPIDELKIYDRVLPGDEIRRQLRELAPLHCQVLPQILAPGTNRLRLLVDNQGPADVVGRLEWELLDPAQTAIAQGSSGPLQVPSGGACEVALTVAVTSPGDYSLVLTSAAENGLRRVLPLHLPRPVRLGAAQRDPQPELELVDQIDCGQELPAERFLARGESRLVQSPLGTYREAAPETWSRLVYTINVEAVQEPHLVTIRYPDDRARCAFVMVRGANKNNHYALHAGYSLGAEFPTTGELQTAHYLWWPMEKRNALMLCSWWGDQPAAVRDIKVEKIVGGTAAIPRLAVRAPRDEPGRFLAIEWEDASLASNFGFDLEPALTLDRFGELSDRLIAYMGFAGMDTLVYPATFYFGPLYRQPRTTGLGNRLELHPEGWLELLLARFSQAGLGCYPALNFHSTPFLVEQNLDDPLRIAAGADTFFQVPYDGVVPRYTRGDSTLDPLHPAVRQQTLEMIEAIVARCEDQAAYRGIQLCFWPYRQVPFCYLSIRHGYGDETIRQFERDTGIRTQEPVPGAARFYQRYRFLLESHRAEWVDWRCRRIAAQVTEAVTIARRKNPEARVLIPLLQEAWPDEVGLYRKLLSGRTSSETEWRERGVDLKLLAQIPGVQIQRQTRDAYRRYLHGKEAKSSRDNASSWEISAPFRETPSGAYPFNHYYENRWQDVPVPGGWWRDEWSAGTANGGGRYYLEASAWALYLQDAQSLCRGACSEEAQASLWECREFARAYRTLPEKPFVPWTQTVIEPAAVRQYEGKAGHYLYAVNAMYCPLELTLQLSPPGSVTDLASEASLAPTAGTLTVSLRPYELRSFLGAPGTTITAARVALPDAVVAELRQRGEGLRAAFVAARATLPEEDRLAHEQWLAELDRLLATKGYYRAWRLLESERADRLLAAPGTAVAVPVSVPVRPPEIDRNLLAHGDFSLPAELASGAEREAALQAVGITDRSSAALPRLNQGRKGEPITAARVAVVAEGGREGSSCLRVEAAGNAQFALSLGLGQEVVPGYDYALSFWVRSDRKRTVPLVVSLDHGGDRRWNYRLALGLVGDWQQCRFVLSIPRRFPGEPLVASRLGALNLKSGGEPDAAFPAVFFIDDLTLTCLGPDLAN
jgi:hypothetical protein